MAQQQVVDIEALSRIGRQTQEVREPNKSMDQFLQFAGGIAVNLFHKAWEGKKLANLKNQTFLSEKTANLRELNPTLKKKVTDVYTTYADSMEEGVKNKYGVFNTQISRKAKDKSRRGTEGIEHTKNAAFNTHDDMLNYIKEQKKANSIWSGGSYENENGQVVTAIWGEHNLPEDILFPQEFLQSLYIKIGS